jgi:hypothetical protein
LAHNAAQPERFSAKRAADVPCSSTGGSIKGWAALNGLTLEFQ